jgi:DNA invertase Pin-like site-specific DNA recombinase
MLFGTMARRMARKPKERVPAIAYLRTSSATNVGTDKDSDKRQREAIEAFVRRGGYELVREFRLAKCRSLHDWSSARPSAKR